MAEHPYYPGGTPRMNHVAMSVAADQLDATGRADLTRWFSEVFGFEETHHYHFDGVVEDLPERDVSMHLHAVGQAAREVMSRMVVRPPDRDPNRR